MSEESGDSQTSAGPATTARLTRRSRRRLSLHEEVVNQLRDLVLEGELPPGRHLRESELSEALDISRTPLREALKVLANEGLVRLLPHRGAVVTEVTVDEVADLFQVMAVLEHLTGQLAALRATPADIEEITSIHKRMVQCYRRRRRTDYFRMNQTIHRRLVELSGNTVLCDVHASLSDKVKRARYLANQSVVRWQESVEEHESIVDALSTHDAQRLGSELSEHIRRTGEIVVDALRALDNPAHQDAPAGDRAGSEKSRG